MPSHGSGRFLGIARDQCLDDIEVFARFDLEAVEIAAIFVALPSHVAECTEENFQSADFFRKKMVAARFRNQVVQPAVDGPGLGDKSTPKTILDGHQSAQFGGEGLEPTRFDVAAGQTGRLAFENFAHLIDFAHFVSGDVADDRSTVWKQVDDADPGQRDQRFPYGSMADAEARRQLLGYQMRAGLQAALEHIAQDRLDDGLPA